MRTRYSRAVAHTTASRFSRGSLIAAFGLLGALGCGDDGSGAGDLPAAEVGTLEVSWSLQDAEGNALDCSARGIQGFAVAAGGADELLVCGDPQTVTFINLTPGRYPVRIDVLTEGSEILAQHLGNVVVAGGAPTAYAHTFTIGAEETRTGTLDVRWYIDTLPAQSSCGAVGGSSVRIELTSGPVADTSYTASCVDGQMTITGIRRGDYDVELTLLDTSGARVGFTAVDTAVTIEQDQTTVSYLSVTTSLPATGAIDARWTVNGTTAATGCSSLVQPTVQVVLRSDEDGGDVYGTSTASCARGQLTFQNVRIGRGTAGYGLRAVFSLVENGAVANLVDFQTIRDIVAVASSTVTVTATLSAGGL